MKVAHASSRGGRSVSLAVKRKRAAAKTAPLLPHEQDQTAAAGDEVRVPPRAQPRIEQAQNDVERGVVDTERRGIPSDVPAPDTERGRGNDSQ